MLQKEKKTMSTWAKSCLFVNCFPSGKCRLCSRGPDHFLCITDLSARLPYSQFGLPHPTPSPLNAAQQRPEAWSKLNMALDCQTNINNKDIAWSSAINQPYCHISVFITLRIKEQQGHPTQKFTYGNLQIYTSTEIIQSKITDFL